MRKTFFALMLILLGSAGSLLAQKQLYFGLAGTGLSSIITNQNNYGLPFEMDYEATFGGAGNVNIGFDFNQNIGLKLEIGFAKLGQNYKDNYMDTVYSRHLKLNYLQIPLLFKYRTNGEVAKFYAMAGPQINFLLSASQKYLKQDDYWNDTIQGNWSEPQVIGEKTITDRFNSIDVLARIDFGVDIQFTDNLFMNAGVSMGYGLLDINASDWQNPLQTPGYDYNPSHNIYGGINIGINYILPLGSKSK